METCFETRDLTKRLGKTVALDRVTLAGRVGRVIGLVGRNGSGKTTLLRHLVGLYVPTGGACEVFATPCAQLGERELARIGVVHQTPSLLEWMRGDAHLEFVQSFLPRWDHERQRRLTEAFDLDLARRIDTMSPGNAQKLAVIAAVCHHPDLLVLDEPVGALDPLAREELLRALLDIVREDGCTIVVSSHVLRDVERVCDWVVCLDRGRVVQDAALDDLAERYAAWRVTSLDGELPARFAEGFVLEQHGDRRQALLVVDGATGELEPFARRHRASVEASALNLERMFPLWVRR